MTEYKIHPTANLFPMMPDDDLQALARDIEENGQREPIELFEGSVIDGRNRLKACRMLGIEPDVCELEELEDPVSYVLSHNLHRRHLTPSQRAQVASRVKDLYSKQAKERQREATVKGNKSRHSPVPETFPELVNQGDARDKAGAAVGVSGKLVDMAARVLKEGSDELNQAVADGEVTVSRAVKVLGEPKRKQLQAAKTRKPKLSKWKQKQSAWEEFQQYMLNLAGLYDGLLSRYDRSMATLLSSDDWNNSRNQMALNYTTESIKMLEAVRDAIQSHMDGIKSPKDQGGPANE